MFIVQTKHHVNVRLDMDSCRILYGIAFTIKMSKKEDHQIDGYFDYVVPPLEGFWWRMEYPELIMLVRKILSGFLLFACQILLPGKISTGLSGKLRQRKSRIFLSSVIVL